MKRIVLTALLLGTAGVPSLASAQTAPAAAPAAAPAPAAGAAPTVGATVYDTSGGTVGTIASTDGTNAVIDTGAVKAAVPLTSLGAGAKGPVLAMTKAQLDAAAGQQQAQASADFKAKLTPGASVYGTGGTQLGTIKTVDASTVTVTTAQGDAALPIAGFGPGPQGVTIGMTAAQLSAAMGGAAASTGAATTGATTAATSGTTSTTTETTTTASTPAADAGGQATTTTTTEKKTTKRKPR